jgi:hypothetical protein
MLAVLALVAAIGGAAREDGLQPLREGARVRALGVEDPADMATVGKSPLVGRVVSVRSESVTWRPPAVQSSYASRTSPGSPGLRSVLFGAPAGGLHLGASQLNSSVGRTQGREGDQS